MSPDESIWVKMTSQLIIQNVLLFRKLVQTQKLEYFVTSRRIVFLCFGHVLIFSSGCQLASHAISLQFKTKTKQFFANFVKNHSMSWNLSKQDLVLGSRQKMIRWISHFLGLSKFCYESYALVLLFILHICEISKHWT